MGKYDVQKAMLEAIEREVLPAYSNPYGLSPEEIATFKKFIHTLITAISDEKIDVIKRMQEATASIGVDCHLIHMQDIRQTVAASLGPKKTLAEIDDAVEKSFVGSTVDRFISVFKTLPKNRYDRCLLLPERSDLPKEDDELRSRTIYINDPLQPTPGEHVPLAVGRMRIRWFIGESFQQGDFDPKEMKTSVIPVRASSSEVLEIKESDQKGLVDEIKLLCGTEKKIKNIVKKACAAIESKVCLDARLEAFLNEVKEFVQVRTFEQLVAETRSKLTATTSDYFDMVAAFLCQNWNQCFQEVKPSAGSPNKHFASEHFPLLKKYLLEKSHLDLESEIVDLEGKVDPAKIAELQKKYLREVNDVDPLILLEIYKKLDERFRIIFGGYLKSQHPEILERIKDVETKDENIVLDLAIRLDDAAFVEHRLKRGDRLDVKNSKNQTPVILAAECGSWTCVETIVRREQKADYREVLFIAARANRKDVVSGLLETKIDPSFDEPDTGLTAFHYSLLYNDRETAKRLLAFDPRFTAYPLTSVADKAPIPTPFNDGSKK